MRRCLLAFGLLASAAFADEELRSDWREECRLALSGAFLAQRSEAEMLVQNQAALKERIAGLEKALTSARRDAAAIKKETSQADFEPALAEREVAANDRVHLLATQLDENKAFLAETKTKHQTLAKSVAAFEGRLTKVFKIERSKTEGREPVLSYLSPCPRFLAVCPLPEKQRGALLKMADGKVPVACERYAHIR